jgi:predicted MFS family arabinose efflux permease
MASLINLLAFVNFAASLFARSVDPLIPQVAASLNVEMTTAALLSTAFALSYALIQPVLGALADVFSKTWMIAGCMLVLGLATLAGGLATSFEMLFVMRVLAGIGAGGIFPIAMAVAGDHVPVAQRQVAFGKLLFAGMTGILLGASGSGVIADLVGWRGVFFATGGIDLLALALVLPRLRGMPATTRRFDLAILIPNYVAIFRNPLAKICFGAVFLEAVFMFGVFPYMAGLLNTDGELRASIAGLVLAGFGVGGVIYTLRVSWLLRHLGEQRLMMTGGIIMGFCLLVIAARFPWPVEFANFVLIGFGFYMLHAVIHIYVSELAPRARGSAMSLHSFFFFMGQAAGPVVYGFGLSSVGIRPVLIFGAVVLATVGTICARRLRRPEISAV